MGVPGNRWHGELPPAGIVRPAPRRRPAGWVAASEGQRKSTYHTAFLLCGIALVPLGAAIVVDLARFDGRLDAHFWLTLVCVWACIAVVARAAARAVCRYRGFDKGSRRDEAMGSPATRRASARHGKTLVGLSRLGWAAVGGLSTLAAIGAAKVLTRVPGMGDMLEPMALACGFGVIALIAFACALTRAGAVAEVNDLGVTRRSLFGNTHYRVPWEQVAECTTDTTRDVSGQPLSTVYTLRDAGGRLLLRLELPGGTTKFTPQLLAAIQARHGLTVPTELESAPPPDGTGTELEASSPPEGRGTELEATLEAIPPVEEAPAVRQRWRLGRAR